MLQLNHIAWTAPDGKQVLKDINLNVGDGKLVVLGTAAVSNETLTPDCILCDDIEVGTAADEKVAVYTAGCFDIGKVTVSASYTITEGDKDNLRMRGIVFKAAAAAN